MIDTAGTDFPLENIPFGIFSTATLSKRPGTAIGSFCVDLRSLEEQGKIGVAGTTLFATDSLAPFMQQGRKCWQTVRKQLQALLAATAADAAFLAPLSQAKMHLPCVIGDYTDFYASKEHAVNIGTMFRGKENALMPNWFRVLIQGAYPCRIPRTCIISGCEWH